MLKYLQNRFFRAKLTAANKLDDKKVASQLLAEGNSHEDAGRHELALDFYRQALRVAPDSPEVHLNLGILFASIGDLDGAERAYQAVLSIDPLHVLGNYNYARLAYLSGDFSLARSLLQQALSRKEDFLHAQILLSTVLDATGDVEAAAHALEETISMHPNHEGVMLNLSQIYRRLRRRDKSEAILRELLSQNPSNMEALYEMSSLMSDHGLANQALKYLRDAIRLDPSRMELQSKELFLMGLDEDVSADELYRQHVLFGKQLEAMVAHRFPRQRSNDTISRKLRIGYVSSDLHVHPVALFLMPLLEHHNKEQFEVSCFSSSLAQDHITERIRKSCDHWIDAQHLSDAELASMIHADAIDILVDLGGHANPTRLAVFAAHPAPVQVSWLGYLNTTGLTSMDYRLCDARTDPIEPFQALHTERLWHLPNSLWCYRPLLDAEISARPPYESNGYITFGSFNNAMRISSAMSKRWAQLLVRIPTSRLVIANVDSEKKKAEILQEMVNEGVIAERIDFVPRVNLDQYLQLYYTVDISLDTHPYGGGTTTLDSLWMGVPVLTALGSTSVSRSAASILGFLGLHEWIATSVDEYVDVAVDCASKQITLKDLRSTLRQTMKGSPLCDVARFAHDIELAYRSMSQANT